MIFDKNFVFIHIPKTGGTWMRHACKQLPTYQGEINNHISVTRVPTEHRNKPVFAIARNPWDWYVSIFTHHQFMGENLKKHPELLQRGLAKPLPPEFKFDSFEQSLDARSTGEIPTLSQTVEKLTNNSVRFYHFETKPIECLLAFLSELSVKVAANSLQKLRSIPKINEYDHKYYAHYYTPRLRELVTELDSEFIERFGYTFGGRRATVASPELLQR
jgi:hypothetical protein